MKKESGPQKSLPEYHIDISSNKSTIRVDVLTMVVLLTYQLLSNNVLLSRQSHSEKHLINIPYILYKVVSICEVMVVLYLPGQYR